MYLGADSHKDLYTIYDANAEPVKEEEFTLQDLRGLRIEEMKLNERLTQIKVNMKEAEKQLKCKLSKYFTGSYTIKFDEHTNCEVICKTFTLERLELMKKEMGLEDVKVKTCTLGENRGKIVITLLWLPY